MVVWAGNAQATYLISYLIWVRMVPSNKALSDMHFYDTLGLQVSP